MAKRTPKKKTPKQVEMFTHDEASRKNIPTAEYESVMRNEDKTPLRIAYERRNRDLDPQLVWRGKDELDWSDLVVLVPPLYIQEKVHPKVLIDDLVRRTQAEAKAAAPQLDLFADFNGLPSEAAKTEFYQHDQNWSNRMILGDSLQVMASLAEREGLRGKVQCIYLDPPYGIKFNSNFQWSTTSRDVKDGKASHITREPEQVKAFRDTWRDGIHSYLTYLRDRLTVARDLLADSGSVFVQIGDENVHRVRALIDEVFGDSNFIAEIRFRKKTMPLGANYLEEMYDFIIWYAKSSDRTKYRKLLEEKDYSADFHLNNYEDEHLTRHKITRTQIDAGFAIPSSGRRFRIVSLWPASYDENAVFEVKFRGKNWLPPNGQCYPTSPENVERLVKADHIEIEGEYLRKVLFEKGSNYAKLTSTWSDTIGARDKSYVVETSPAVLQRCLLMTTDPGDLVLDPTCGSGTTAYIAEQWGRRWITIDTSRVALALARARIMGARYPYYLLADSREGQLKEAQIARTAPSEKPTYGDIRQGFVYQRVPHITLKSIANNAEIDVIWEKYQEKLEPLRKELNESLGESWEEWEIPRDAQDDWPAKAKEAHAAWWKERIARQQEIDASIAAKADYEYLYDKPYEDKKIIRVAAPFTVESLSPHRVLGVDENDELIDPLASPSIDASDEAGFIEMILDNLKTAGVQQAHKEDKIVFTSLAPWPGRYVCAEGRYIEGSEEKGISKRAAIFIGPEFGTVSRPDLVAAAREAGDANFDVLIACAFNYDAHSSEFGSLGRVLVLKARMNADLHMAEDLKKTTKGNLFVIFGEPDISVVSGQWLVTSKGKELANYDIVKELSGLGSLEEINRAGREGLSLIREISQRGKVWHDESVASGSGISSGEHSGGRRTAGDEGVSSVSERGERIAGGSGDIPDSGNSIENGGRSGNGANSGVCCNRWSNAQRTQTVFAVENLTAADFPFSLTTDHRLQITVHGVDVFDPSTGEVRSDSAEGIACWFIDTDYNEESFFVRQAYFLGANDPYKALKTTLKAEINQEAWETLHSDTSRPFDKPESGRIAVKVINHLGDEVMKVFRVD